MANGKTVTLGPEDQELINSMTMRKMPKHSLDPKEMYGVDYEKMSPLPPLLSQREVQEQKDLSRLAMSKMSMADMRRESAKQIEQEAQMKAKDVMLRAQDEIGRINADKEARIRAQIDTAQTIKGQG